MNQQQFNFRSRTERERDSKLVSNYREIGIAAVLAAKATRRKDESGKAAAQRTVANVNARD
ncbi:hypothetical protein [Aureimonas phyllosphaerae]|uniref:Uncharacterized protein n=1 Tax=Aureimonas phyllosphaerae TaxID=1166078 RepID=A0A7W6FT25_9HYPH|nr:hypothetical protein [Aureimonas phyllosphaerae]MBB3934563.1 hypothetical protein [Aureimonas phyllosphaerae]MBB3958221.1 hypothetical protein [Aureimonas phyllosphaerae]SFE93798.1 hypothetical protein SAMN05216566_101191 [Aureimonas phyllosphaerae]